MFESVLVANRGEIARRVVRTVRRMGLRAVAVYSEADADLPFVREADEAFLLGPAAPARSYLDVARVLEACRATGAQAVHPGYGFLAENAAFARAVIDAGLGWIGPAPEAMERMGDKINARNLMEAAGVPVAAGTREPVTSEAEALAAAERIGYPVMVKTAGGGGGIGMGVAHDAAGLAKAFATAARAAERFGGEGGDAARGPAILLERYVARARHVEVQILGLADGTVVALGERDCSVQRRHQKVVEESPSPGVSAELRERMLAAAVRAGEAVDYQGAGTVECLVDTEAQEFVFLEMNTRLQVEHPVTELVTGVDLVEQQVLVAAGEPATVPAAPRGRAVESRGHAIEFRVYAEDPKRFFPGPGKIDVWEEPAGPGIRLDSGYVAGNTVTPFYDPLMAKLCVHGADREEALERAREAVAAFRVEGPKNNLPFFVELLENAEFVSGDYDTGLVGRMRA
ncbi:biotin carboxylase N-terminal domain-containing protein [Sphaerisporangium sp. TRM90804]|uniref:acetyl-CoA carboxylase biotin carboxylase subunit n=1 Tax=Sphaerisporangium sp. TRM90804 TaxID=3031113 RepID=UPI00244BE7F0|nr:biotin carboxylase N-terminal domain-containing protein [Sphaerisporangium sp. TRM90804]MDH2427787.1 biotin carboxylase N-terminal domain-containing protein [Sphaerisporangium sp. TRM90804]